MEVPFSKQPVANGQHPSRAWGRHWSINVLFFFLCTLAAAAPGDAIPYEVAVLYPEVEGNYRQIFDNILAGFAQFPMTRATPIPLKDGTTADEVDQRLRERQARAVITLGVKSYKVARQLHSDLPVIIGALVVSPNGITGVSLAGDPAEFFTRLQYLAPQVKRVFIVYSEANSGWLVKQALLETRQRGLQLVALRADNVREALHDYEYMLSQARDETDAIWLPLDSIVPDDTILPMVLEEAWKRHLVVFSNNPVHTRMGALFALYPDHQAMGRHLAQLTAERLLPDSRPRVIPTREMKMAVNQRTASHLGLYFSSHQRQEFDVIYPAE